MAVGPTQPHLAPPVPPRMSFGELHDLMGDVFHLSTTVEVSASALGGMSPAQIAELVSSASNLAQRMNLLSSQRQHWGGSLSMLAAIDKALEEGAAVLARVSSS